MADYDEFSDAYDKFSTSNAWNVLYDRPAILDMLGDVSGKRILEVGCAAGAMTEQLVERGAQVTGLDISKRNIHRAVERLAGKPDGSARFALGDLREPLDFAEDGDYDRIVASLVLHYVRDWGPTLQELYRVLKPGGEFVMSTHHPCEDWRWLNRQNYFATELVTDRWTMEGSEYAVRFYRRPLHAVFSAIRGSGFVLEELSEPMPLPECAESFPEAYEILTTQPRFLYLRCAKP
ncbi:class I SAM-dependent methyltransferase [Streptomyces angustmyceticus]|uniref:Methyltransferase type 11 domain-containing protein n=1 Tax=Streptomyces angustmyceticus TaxID=285578 RepID=A0A5J4LEH9_9ACTN|nr:class I SAM-dependent methyltransferase [Streptomyces angustmyceticus]UAL71001.1 class I SAM-dependent methyltransferase [Streptomyces angustmyceticus]GES32573.1 hypothetical protein San01_50600 [Streptomyces angustmyceticus]